MPVRFRKSIKLAPGIRMNLSGSGVGWTLGPRGSSIGISKRGTRLNSNFMGFSSSQKLTGPKKSSRPAIDSKSQTLISLTCEVDDEGNLSFRDANGDELPEHVIDAAKKQNREVILSFIQRKCDDINNGIELLSNIHLDTPNCLSRPTFTPMAFDEPEPIQRSPKKPSLWDRLFKKRMQRITDQNAHLHAAFQVELYDWQQRKVLFYQQAEIHKHIIEKGIYNNTADMEIWLEDVLQGIIWPRETLASFEITESGDSVLFDVDFPELEHMPRNTATVPVRGLKLAVKPMSPTAIQKLYMAHIHGVAFRIIGETFAALPLANTVILSGYSQRPNKATGRVGDEYLLSVRVTRSEWMKIAFDQLAHIDVVASLEQFELRRQMSKTGIFKSIEPFSN